MVHKLNTSQRLKLGKPIETWQTPDGTWTWEVYKKYQKPENEAKNPFARWFCKVKSPFTRGSWDMGDVYVKEIKDYALKVSEDKED